MPTVRRRGTQAITGTQATTEVRWTDNQKEKNVNDMDLLKVYNEGQQHSHLEGVRAVFEAGKLEALEPTLGDQEIEAEVTPPTV